MYELIYCSAPAETWTGKCCDIALCDPCVLNRGEESRNDTAAASLRDPCFLIRGEESRNDTAAVSLRDCVTS